MGADLYERLMLYMNMHLEQIAEVSRCYPVLALSIDESLASGRTSRGGPFTVLCDRMAELHSWSRICSPHLSISESALGQKGDGRR